jgi:hypothetical protein
VNYVFNMGVWFVYDPFARRGGDGAFFLGSRLTPRDFADGLSHTLCAAEAKSFTPYFANAGHANPTAPETSVDICLLGGNANMGPILTMNTGHSLRDSERVDQRGFTAAFPPNFSILCDHKGISYDVDWTNQEEGTSPQTKTFAAVTARSFHPHVVNVLLMDGSVRTISNSIERTVWRALATRSGAETVDENF